MIPPPSTSWDVEATMLKRDHAASCVEHHLLLDVWAQYGELKGFCPVPNCETVIELGEDPLW